MTNTTMPATVAARSPPSTMLAFAIWFADFGKT